MGVLFYAPADLISDGRHKWFTKELGTDKMVSTLVFQTLACGDSLGAVQPLRLPLPPKQMSPSTSLPHLM